nr:reverse transcriptase domain-containing protein [Tanacetum cinerariifolium]
SRWMVYITFLANVTKSLRDTIISSLNEWAKIGPVAYRLRLPEELSSVHNTFHVSNLKKYLTDANLYVPLDEIKIDKTLRFIKEPVDIIDREVRNLKRSKISLVKVHWNSKQDEIKIDKTLCFIEESVDIIDREVRNLKRSKISLVKVH